MDIYFIKATKHGQVYKLSDFYNGTNFKLDPTYKLDVNFKADPTTTIVFTNPNFNPRNFTHIIVPDLNMIYKINRYDYMNTTQTLISVEADEFIANYHEFITKEMYLTRSNHPDNFNGFHDIKDIAIRHIAGFNLTAVPDEYTGLWALYTFQKTAGDITFKFKNIDTNDIPLVAGNFANFTALVNAYPVGTTPNNNPWEVDYYLKFARVGSDTYQCIYRGGALGWERIQTTFPIFNDTTIPSDRSNTVVNRNNTIILTGDVDTINIAFPLDTTLVRSQVYNWDDGANESGTQNVNVSIPSYYNIDSFDNVDALISVKVVPQEFIMPDLSVSTWDTSAKLLRYRKGISTYREIELTPFTDYRVKFINTNIYSNVNTFVGGTTFENYFITNITINQFKNIFEFDYSSAIDITRTAPFRRYYMSFYGQLIEIPNQYLKFNVRVAITSSDVLYEVYTDKYNIIGSGRLQWFSRFSLDQLDIFLANNPTYKDQFMTNQIIGAIQNIGLGAGAGLLTGQGAVGAALGTLKSAVSIGKNFIDRHWMEKGLQDRADQIMGQNDLSMMLLRGFTAILIIIRPNDESLEQMESTYKYIGFPCAKELKINSLSILDWSVYAGNMLEIVKNNYVTNEINKKLAEGVVVEL